MVELIVAVIGLAVFVVAVWFINDFISQMRAGDDD